LAFGLGACGASPKEAADSYAPAPGMSKGDYGEGPRSPDYVNSAESGLSMELDYKDSPSEPGEALGGTVTGTNYGSEVKLIFRAYVELQTLDFKQAEADLDKLVQDFGGYYESVYTDNGNYYSRYSMPYGKYTVRVPAEKYDAFLSAVGNTCHLVSINKSTEDVGLMYSDTEGRLKTYHTKMDRLHELLAKAEEMDDIITLEYAISDCQYWIDSLSSEIKRYDSLIGYSTVTVDLSQVEKLQSPVSDEPAKGFWERLSDSFSEGAEDFFEGFKEFALWVSYNFFGIVVFIVIVAAVIVLIKKRRAKRGKGSLLSRFRKRKDAAELKAGEAKPEDSKERKDS
ncbi:MAG: DUF4349 domain-containing protein, partial [Clostridiales bacterium]|nr:DUF4349 domain-containing protein [Clostridiales bacterium]